jgi:GTP cyclohydrolase IA
LKPTGLAQDARPVLLEQMMKELLDFDDNLSEEDLEQNGIENDLLEDAILQLLNAVGEDPAREGLKYTPKRVARMYSELLNGYHVDPVAMINGALFNITYDEMVLVRDIEFYSLCEHHILPFMGRFTLRIFPMAR